MRLSIKMINFAGINQQTMKKILLLLAASLVLFTGCQKEDLQQEENGFGSVTHEYTCSKCGAVYSVTCKHPNISPAAGSTGGDDWTLITNPSRGEWTVTDESGQNVSHYEALAGYYMYFICTCGEKSKKFNKEEFKTQTATVK